MILTGSILFLFIGYAILILYYWRSWQAIPDFKPTDVQGSTRVSIIIPARNEAGNIGKLLAGIAAQHYPAHLIETIVIDDHSTDNTAEIVRQFPAVKLIQLEDESLNSYKKKAVGAGIASSGGELIVCTDADCTVQPDWISLIVSLYERDRPVFIAAPVVIDCGPGLVEVFQAYDFAVLQGITAASVYRQLHSMSNGANMAYTRAAFDAVNGFEGIDHIASGDDLLLMHKIAQQYPGRIAYLKSTDAIVSTQAVKTWAAFFRQRIRWASKATHYTDKRIFFVLLLVYLFNLSFLVSGIAGFWNSNYWLLCLGCWIAKTIVEFPFVLSVSRFFHKTYLMKFFFFFQPLHITYTILSGLLGQFGKYEWKGRTVR